MVDLPKTDEGYIHILVIKERLTQWVELIPLRTKTSLEVARALFDNVYCRHGAVKHIVSDNGKEFVARVNEAVNHLLQQQAVFTTAYNPQANGYAENQNRTVKDMLAMYVNEQQTNWAKFLPVLAHSYRTTVNSITGYTPYFANHGREATQPADQWISEFARNELRGPQTVDDYVTQLQVALLSCWQLASTRRIEQHSRVDVARDQRHPQPAPTMPKGTRRRKNDRANTQTNSTSSSEPVADPDYHADQEPIVRLLRRFHTYKPGATFYLKQVPKRDFKNPQDEELYKVSKKLQDRYSGPHTVISQINPVIYNCLVHNKVKKIHLNKMKRDTSRDYHDVDFSDAVVQQFQDDSPLEEVPEEHPDGTSPVPASPLAASLPVSPNQASAADAQSPHISSNMTILKPNKQRRRTLRCKPKAGMDLAPDPRAHPDGSRRIQLPLLAPKRSPRPIIQPQQLLHTQDLCARSAILHSEQLPAQTESPDSSPFVPTSLIFGFS
jgi:hypothetical protein